MASPANTNSKRAQRAIAKSAKSEGGSSSSCSSSECSQTGIEGLLSPTAGPQPCDLDEACDYTFKANDRVWVRTPCGDWTDGVVIAATPKIVSTREGEGKSWRVRFAGKLAFFAPLNGEIKPDDGHVRGLLEQAGRL